MVKKISSFLLALLLLPTYGVGTVFAEETDDTDCFAVGEIVAEEAAADGDTSSDGYASSPFAAGITSAGEGSYMFGGTELVASSSIPGYSENFESSAIANPGGFDSGCEADEKKIGYDSGDSHGKVVYMKQNASTAKTKNMQWNASRPFYYESTGTYTSGRYIELSADIKISGNVPSELGFLQLKLLKSNYTDTVNSANIGNFTWSSTGFWLNSSGNLACYSKTNDTGVKADLGNWHNYKVIIDGNLWNGANTKAYYYYDDVLVWTQEKAATSFQFVDRIGVIVPKNTSTTESTEVFIDNVVSKTYNVAIPKITLSASAGGLTSGTLLPSGHKLKLKFETECCANAFASGGYVKLFNNGEQIGGSISSATGEVEITVPSGECSFTAKAFDGNGDAVVESSALSFEGFPLSQSKNSPGYSEDFTATAHYGAFYNADSKSTGYKLTGDPHGYVAYGKQDAATSQSSAMYYNTARAFDVPQGEAENLNVAQGRYFEVSADIKTNASTGTQFHLVNLKTVIENPIRNVASSSFTNYRYTGFIILANGNIACYAANDTGIAADLGNWHNYKIIVDTKLGTDENPVMYYYLDDALIYVQANAASTHRAIDYAQISIPKATKTDSAELYVDNVVTKTYGIAFEASLNMGGGELEYAPYENVSPIITFDKALDETTLSTITLADGNGNKTEITGTYDLVNKAYTVAPVDLSPHTAYSFDLSGVKTSDGTGGTLSLSFTTQKLPFSIKNISVGANSVTVTVNNRTGDAKDCVLIVGCWGENVLYKCKTGKRTVTKDGEQFTFPMTGTYENARYGAYLADASTLKLIDECFE